MTTDIYIIFAAYFISCIALAVSVYSVWTLLEVKEFYKNRNSKPGNAWDHYHSKARSKPKTTHTWKN
jgi:hypothetical protein